MLYQLNNNDKIGDNSFSFPEEKPQSHEDTKKLKVKKN
jgi:hypothetical protein